MQAWVAVAEFVKNCGRQSHSAKNNVSKPTLFAINKRAKLGLLLLTALASTGLTHTVHAQWVGVENTHGQASYEYNGQHLDVRVNTNQLIANARSLDIAKNESVRIHQLTSQDTALFRSIGSSATQIFGSLTANGKVFLVNQNGVLFGQGAQVDVGSLVATSMNITDDDFLKGQYQFSTNGNTANIINHGVIKVADGGYAVLLGKVVENTGSITANNGSVVLASADQAELDFYGNGLVKAKLSGDALKAVINQSGQIQADGGAVQLATNSRSSAVNVSGLVQANTLVERNGVIRLEGGDHAQVGVSGMLSAKGQEVGTTGGSIEVTGEQVALFEGGELDASGQAGGGTVLLGGDYQGKNEKVYNARTAYVDKGAIVRVNAENTGDGGKAIVWADETTRYYGSIEAKGGGQSGDGGFVEVSGKQQLDFIGGVDVSAPTGQGGTVLLDPEFIVLNNSTQTAPTNNADGTPDIAYADAPVVGTTTIQISDVRGYSELFLQATKDITVANNLYMQTNNSIVFEAGRDIHVNAGIRTYGTGSTSLTAANNINANAEIRAHDTGNIDLTAGNDINVGARMYNYGTGYIGLSADADVSGAGDVNINQRIFARQGNITISGHNITNTATGTMVQTQGLVGQDSGNVYITANNAVNLAGNIVTVGRNSTAGLDGANAGLVNIVAAGAITTNNISAYGGNGGTGNTAGGNAGTISIQSTGAGDISTGTLNSRNGISRGTGVGGLQGGINVNNAAGNIATNHLYAHGNNSGDAGNINLVASAGDIAVTGNVYAQGGTTAAGSPLGGTNGGDINMSASGDVMVTSRVYAQGGAVGSGNTASGGHGGNVNISGTNLTFNNVIYAYGNHGRGLNQSGGNAGDISLNATGAITAGNNVYAYGGNGGTGAGSNANAGNAGNITIASTGAGDINIRHVNARNGAARGVGAGGATGSINITNSDGDINTRNLDTNGNLNGDGGDVNVAATNGDVTVAGRVYSYGGGINNGHTLAGRNAGNITISGVNTTITNRVNANGNAAKGSNQAGGDAGTVNISATNALSVRDVYARTGRATDSGAGGGVGSITLNGGTVAATSTISTSGERNGDAGDITITSLTGDTNISNVVASGGSANADTAGNHAGNITLNSAGALVTANVSANGNAGNGLNNAGGNAGVIDVDAAGAITMNAVNASGATGGNAAGSDSNGGHAGSINIRSTAVGDININNTLALHAGAARGSGNGGNAGSIVIKNDAGNIATRNIYAEGYNNGDGSHVNLDAEGAGNVTVTGQIRAHGDVNATGDRAGADGGNVIIKGINTTVTSTINANGYRARGTNQDGGDAGIVAVTGTGDVSLQHVYARNGNATGTGTGGSVGSIDVAGATITAGNLYTSGERNGDGGNINLTSTTGDIAVVGAYAQGGGANTNTAGNHAGNITVNAAGAFNVTNHLYAQGSSGNGNNNNGGDAGSINVNAAGAITAKRVYAYGGNGGGSNTATNTAAGGRAGNVSLNANAAGDITLTDTLNVRTGFSRNAAPGASAGAINLTSSNGNISTRNIRAEGQNHGDGSDVTINAGATGDVSVNGVIYTYGDQNPTATSFAGTDGGDVNITAANVSVTNNISTNGGRGRGANQVGGHAGDITINASGAVSTSAIAANGGNAGSGAGSNAAGGNAGDINIRSTGTGDITATNISARTGYTRGSATATGAGSVNIENDDGRLTANSITTRGQRRGVGGDVLAISAGDFNVASVDARSSNLTAADDGDVTVGTKVTGDTTINSLQTRGRWLVYSGDPRNDSIGAFKPTADFKEYNTHYGDALTDTTGDGFVYRFAPTINTSLTGLATKPYDGNTTAPIAGLTLNQVGGEIDGDIITISGLTSATYDNKNVGTGKTVTSNPLTVISGNNGATAVYGYQVNAATGNVGVITESAQSRLEAATQSNPRNEAGLGSLVTAESSPQQFVTVFDVNATAAGGDGTEGGCQTEEDKSLQNPNTSLMLNFGITLPEGVEQTCDE